MTQTGDGGGAPRPLRVGVLGLVSSYSLLIPEVLRTLPGVQLVGAAHMGRDDRYMAASLALPWLKRFPKVQAEYAAHFCVPVYATEDELFDAGVDAVVLGTEEHLRTAAALGALERGVHVYLPKPFAYTAPDAARLRDGARRSAATLFPGLPHRWHAHFRRAAELLTPDHLGRPLLARSAVVHHLSAGPWKSDPAMAAGPEFEMGFYAVDGLLMVMGATPRHVTAQATNQLHPRIDGFDFATLQVGFDSGTIGTADLYCGLEYPYRGHELQATGEHGGVWLGRGAGGQTELRVYGAEGERDEPVPAMGREAELSRWLEVCRRGDRETAGDLFESGCRTLGVLLAFKEAWRRREAVEVVTP